MNGGGGEGGWFNDDGGDIRGCLRFFVPFMRVLQ